MREIETDYLVIGAGASGMAFVDEIVANTDAEVVIVDRRHRPGGHWIDAYPFARLHQPSANYGVGSRVLGHDRIDASGANAGFYERATAAEICDYYTRVLEEHFLPSGQVRFFGMSDCQGSDADGNYFVSRATGEATRLRIRRKLVDATYLESSIPSRHTPSFEVDTDVRLVTPNELVDLAEPATGFTVIGAGKTSMDTCTWLMDQGVAPDAIRWIRPRDPWTVNRAAVQPLELVASAVEMQSRMIEAIAEAEQPDDYLHRLEANGIVARIDPDVTPEVFRFAILSTGELEALRTIERVVRRGKVQRITTDGVTMTEGSIPSDPGQVYVDCTAAGLRANEPRPIFEPDRIVMQGVTLGVLPWSAATLGYVEASRTDDEDKNRLCAPLGFAGGDVSDLFRPSSVPFFYAQSARMAEPDLVAWNEACRLNPGRGVADHLDEPRVQEAFARLATNMEPAMANLERLSALSPEPSVP